MWANNIFKINVFCISCHLSNSHGFLCLLQLINSQDLRQFEHDQNMLSKRLVRVKNYIFSKLSFDQMYSTWESHLVWIFNQQVKPESKWNFHILLLEPRIQIFTSMICVYARKILTIQNRKYSHTKVGWSFLPNRITSYNNQKHQMVVHFYFSLCLYKLNTGPSRTGIVKKGEKNLLATKFQVILDKNSVFNGKIRKYNFHVLSYEYSQILEKSQY